MSEKKILTVIGENTYEKIIEKSRFIAYVKHVESEEDARGFLACVRKEHSLATHVCFAFIADKAGNLCRFSDDGEPQGTAGLPILEVIKNKNLTETAVAVVRYFGGIKLGAGGLVRAYSSTTSEALSNASIHSVELCEEWSVFVDYTGVDGLQKYLSSARCVPLSSEYGERVEIRIAVKKAEVERVISALVDYMQGRVQTKKEREYYNAFPL